MSPSRRFAVTINFEDGRDVYDLKTGRLVKTIREDPAELFMSGVGFVDEETVVTGHSRGPVVISHCGPTMKVESLLIDAAQMDREYRSPW